MGEGQVGGARGGAKPVNLRAASVCSLLQMLSGHPSWTGSQRGGGDGGDEGGRGGTGCDEGQDEVASKSEC